MTKAEIIKKRDIAVDRLNSIASRRSADYVDDIAQAAVDAMEQVDWVKSVLAEYGYSGPLAEGCCPLREMLSAATASAAGVPDRFCQYTIDWGGIRRHTFDLGTAQTWLHEAAAGEDEFTYTPDWFDFQDEWESAQSLLSQGQALGAANLHALKLGIAAGMKIEL